jgi:hypothetical protein
MLLAQANETWGDELRNGFEGFFAFIPNLIGFLVVLIIGYIVAKVLANVATRVLARTGLDERLTRGQGGTFVSKVTERPSWLLGRIVFWALFLGVLAIAVPILGIAAFTNFVAAIFAYLPNVIVALLIFLVAGAIAAGAGALVARTMGDTPTGRVVGTVVPILIMAIAGFMILDQLMIAETIVTITYAALMGALALGAALAFGLGGRDVAARMLEGAYVKGQESKEQVRRDMQVGRERARQDMERTRERIEGDDVTGPPSRVGTTDTEYEETQVGTVGTRQRPDDPMEGP